ncbi:MAG: hypothetical protein FWH55_13915 [Oscillospiraceae bacterium]|nr:hypothetical protein [Oscillospiraceae bacterium]
MQNYETAIKRALATALTFEEKGKREWAYAVNGYGGYHYEKARQAFEKAERCREIAKSLSEKSLQGAVAQNGVVFGKSYLVGNVAQAGTFANLVGNVGAAQFGAAIGGGIEAVVAGKDVIEGTIDVKEAAERVVEATIIGGVSGAGSAIAGTAASALLSATACPPLVPVVGGVLAAMLAAKAVNSAGPEVLDTAFDVAGDVVEIVGDKICDGIDYFGDKAIDGMEITFNKVQDVFDGIFNLFR